MSMGKHHHVDDTDTDLDRMELSSTSFVIFIWDYWDDLQNNALDK